MASSAAEVVITALIFVGFVLTVIATIIPSWEKSDLESIAIHADYKYNGLWTKCQAYSTGKYTCNIYPSFFIGLSPHLQGARGFSLFSVMLGIVSIIMCVLAVSSLPCSSSSSHTRNRIRLMGGGLALVSGLSILSGVSWFAANVLHKYYREQQFNTGGEKMAFGEALFIGWVAAFFLVIGGLAAMCMSCDESDDDRPAPYISASIARKEYV